VNCSENPSGARGDGYSSMVGGVVGGGGRVDGVSGVGRVEGRGIERMSARRKRGRRDPGSARLGSEYPSDGTEERR
jgi:hypothetical protein